MKQNKLQFGMIPPQSTEDLVIGDLLYQPELESIYVVASIPGGYLLVNITQGTRYGDAYGSLPALTGIVAHDDFVRLGPCKVTVERL